ELHRGDRENAGPGAEVEHTGRSRLQELERLFEQTQAAFRAAVVAGAERSRRFDDELDARVDRGIVRLPRRHDEQTVTDVERWKRLLPSARPVAVVKRGDLGLE